MKSHLHALLLTLSCVACHAHDLPPGDPVRKDVIADLRKHPSFAQALKDVRLDVRRIWASSQYAYLCALPIDLRGRYQMTDGWYDVYQVVLKRQNDSWVMTARVDGLSEVLKDVQCLSDAQGNITDAFLEEAASDARLRAP